MLSPGRLRFLLVIVAFALLAGCAQKPRIQFIPEGGSYTTDAAMDAARAVDLSAVSALDTENVAEDRQDALASLRSSDGGASELADLITSTFAADTRSVPVYAEAATVDGRAAWIVVEAWGGRSGPLDKRRIWILARETGDIISSGTAD